ncbi:MAG: hypothetical protein KDC80_15215 [Saprospiraceae bacterium]|nr:hypothetical protein [Saprospiraceae bacterium]
MKSAIILVLLCFCSIAASAQATCGTHDAYLEQMKNNPEFRLKQEQSKQSSSSGIAYEGIVTIPVVVHVVYNIEAENVSDEQIYSQLDVLNEDFNSVITSPTQWHEVAANPEMQFCLATRDPFGNATCGITRTYTDSTEFHIQTSVKDESTGGISGWPARDYLNIFICDIANLRGYATFPDAEDSIDGVVLDYLSVGRGEEFAFSDPNYNLGRTGTHEVGHWLRLTHIWGDGNCNIDDGIMDTPNAPGPNYLCNVDSPACPNQSPGYAGPLICMVQNYMDYSDDACMNLFTQGQVDLMRKAFDSNGSRVSILSSRGCDPPAQNLVTFTLNFDEFPGDMSWEIIDEIGNIVASDGNFPPGDEFTPSPLAHTTKVYTLDVPDGNYTLKLYDSYGDGFCCGVGGYKIELIYDDLVIDGPDFDGSELSVPFSVNSSNFRFVGGSATGSMVDWYDPANWNRRASPGDCYEGDIIIESDCVKNDGLEINPPTEFIVEDGVQFTVNN